MVLRSARAARQQNVGVEFGAGVVEARDPAPDVARVGGGSFGLYSQIADDVDALAGGGVFEGDPGGPDCAD